MFKKCLIFNVPVRGYAMLSVCLSGNAAITTELLNAVDRFRSDNAVDSICLS